MRNVIIRIGRTDVVTVVVVYGIYVFLIYRVAYFVVVNVEFFGIGFFYFGVKVILEDDVVNKID